VWINNANNLQKATNALKTNSSLQTLRLCLYSLSIEFIPRTPQIKYFARVYDLTYLDKISQTDAEWHVIWSKSKTNVEFQYGGRLGEFHGMWSHSHLPHCRVLPLGEFTVRISELHATLQGVIIPPAILKIVFRHIFLFFKMQFGLWRAAAFISSPIHLFYNDHRQTVEK